MLLLRPQRLLVTPFWRRKNLHHYFRVAALPPLPCTGIITRGINITTKRRRRLITFLTDVEGDAAYLDRYVRQSRVLTFRPVEPRWNPRDHKTPSADASAGFGENFLSCAYFPYNHCIDFGREDWYEDILVFGGDIWDKGGADLYCIRQLLDFKRRYPDRVHWTLGNRDINKMRIPQEMGLSNEVVLPAHDGVYWLNNTGSVGDPSDPNKRPPSTAVERLKWMLGQTMGSPDAFEGRRSELQLERRQLPVQLQQHRQHDTDVQQQEVTDDEVVQSYRQSCHPTKGEMGNYLCNAHLAFRIGEALFVHGALPLSKPVIQNIGATNQDHNVQHFWDDLSFAMPWVATRKEAGHCNISIDEWFLHLQQFLQTSVQAWKNHYATKKNCPLVHDSENIFTLRGGYNSKVLPVVPYANLLQYGMGWLPDRLPNTTCVYSGWTRDGMPKWFVPHNGTRHAQLFAKLTKDFLRRSGLRLILSGHQPQGDFPTPIRLEVTKENSSAVDSKCCWILCCDTSYSGDVEWINRNGSHRKGVGRGIGPGFRGDAAVCETLIEQFIETGQILDIRCHGVLSDGSQYEAVFLSTSAGDDNPQTKDANTAVGCLVPTDCVPLVETNQHESPWWTKAVFNDGSYLLTNAKGYDVYNCMIHRLDP